MTLKPRNQLHQALEKLGGNPTAKNASGRRKTRRDLTEEIAAAVKRSAAQSRSIELRQKADRSADKAKVLYAARPKPATETDPDLIRANKLDAVWEAYHRASSSVDRRAIYAEHATLILHTSAIRRKAAAIRHNAAVKAAPKPTPTPPTAEAARVRAEYETLPVGPQRKAFRQANRSHFTGE